MKVKIRGLVFAGFAAAVFAQSAMAAQTDDNTVTSKTYVDTKFQAQAKRVTSENIDTIVPSNDDVWNHDDLYPSMKVLKDNGVVDAQPKADTLVDEGVLEQNAAWIGWHNGDNNEQVDWVKLKGEGYTEIRHDASKGHLVKIVDSKIANTAAVIAGDDGQGPASADFDDLTTAKAVYDFVSAYAGDTYQPKATDTTGAQVGVKNGNSAEWYNLLAGQDGRTLGTNSQDVAYTQIYRDDATGANAGHTAGVYVDLDHDRVMLASTYTGSDFQKGIASVTNNIEGAGLALATAGAVKEYVDSITNGNSLPVMPDACEAANVHCALVTNYATTAVGTQGEPDYHPAGSTWLEWTVMAVTQ